MPHEPKLEIFTISICKKENGQKVLFRDFFRDTLPGYNQLEVPIAKEDIFELFYKDFIKTFENRYKVDNTRKKALTLTTQTDQDGTIKTLLSLPRASDQILCGRLDGGPHGRKRKLGEITNPNNRQEINTNNIVCDEYFFLIHVPLDSKVGIAMIQSYTDLSISNVFVNLLEKYFKKRKTFDNKITRFMPSNLRQEFIDGATVSAFTFSKDWTLSTGFDDDDDPEMRTYDFRVKIEIVDKNPETEVNQLRNLLNAIGLSKFMPPQENASGTKLLDFDKVTGRIISESGSSTPVNMEIDGLNEIKPVIYLESYGVDIDPLNLSPNFEQIETVSRSLLEIAMNELYEDHAVIDLD